MRSMLGIAVLLGGLGGVFIWYLASDPVGGLLGGIFVGFASLSGLLVGNKLSDKIDKLGQ
jgi:hypothetical protein